MCALSSTVVSICLTWCVNGAELFTELVKSSQTECLLMYMLTIWQFSFFPLLIFCYFYCATALTRFYVMPIYCIYLSFCGNTYAYVIYTIDTLWNLLLMWTIAGSLHLSFLKVVKKNEYCKSHWVGGTYHKNLDLMSIHILYIYIVTFKKLRHIFFIYLVLLFTFYMHKIT